MRVGSIVTVLAALTGAAGCQSRAAVPEAPGATAILLSNQVNGPCQLTWANANVDGRSLERTTIAPPGAPPASLERPVLAPGQHVITLTAAASCEGKDQGAVLTFSQPVYMRNQGGAITIQISGNQNTPSGLEAKLTIEGGELLNPRADGGELNCRGRMPMDSAICRTEAALGRARSQRDLVLTLCLSEKLREMRVIADTTQGQKTEATDLALAGQQDSAVARVLVLAREAESCIGLEMMGREGSHVERTPVNALNAFK
ncbi:MAG: hypothetical protein IPK82_01430 [Polyangiaceae bacterium]|nr:hypothetical protein [Polyangiaceae bacterium]